MNTTFAILLTQLLNQSGYSALKAHKLLENAGVSISYPTFAAYKNFTVVPPYDKALAIVRFFGYDISEENLKTILENSRIELKRIKNDSQADIRTGIRLNPRLFNETLSAAELDVMISRRMNELFEDGNMNMYITYLIRNDLIANGYLQEEQ